VTKTFCLTVAFFTLVAVSGCGGKGSGGSDNARGPDPKADLGRIWSVCKDHYRKTQAMPAPNELPDRLAAKYNYESTAGISLNKHSTSVIAYESKSIDGKRYALFSDGRIESVTDKQLEAVGVDPNPAGSGQP
jgi:hypothetical protein